MLGRASRTPASASPRRPGRIAAAVLGTAGILAAVAGCGLLGGSNNDAKSSDKLERTNLTIGAMTIMDSAPVQLQREARPIDDREQGLLASRCA